jgi:hypothetical protein
MSQNEKSALSLEMAQLAVRLNEIRQEAQRLGIFIEDRPLLQCPHCGLWEDVGVDGRLLTCFASDVASGKRVVDTGLRFESVADGFLCPSCQSYVPFPVEEEET